MADWEKDEDGVVTYYGYGRVVSDNTLKSILIELARGGAPFKIARKRKLNVRIIHDIIRYFQENSG